MIMEVPFYGFESPWRLWLLLIIPALIVAYVLAVRRRSQQGMRYPNTTVLGQVLPKQSQWLRHVVVALSVLSLLALGVAWAQPLGQEKVPRERATVVVAVDISLSMTATDVAPTRMDAAKKAAASIVDQLPQGYNVALVEVSGSPTVRLSPTQDHNAVDRAIEVLTPKDSSAIGNGITTALAAVDQAPTASDGSVAPAMIILLSDGGNTNGQAPQQAAQQAGDKGVPVYAVEFGTANGYVDLDGQRQAVPPDSQMMQEIAQYSHGQYYTADNMSQVDSAAKSLHSELGYELQKKEITATAAGLSLIFAFVAAVGAVMLGVRFR